MIRPLGLLLALLPAAAAAQPDVSVGTSATLGYRQYLDVPMQCCPLWTWIEFGSGRFRLHLDYLYSYRESEGHGGYSLDGDNPFGLSPQNALLLWHSLRVARRHEAGAMLAWTARQRPEYKLNVLAGVSYLNSHVSDCLAREGPIEEVIPIPEDYSYDSGPHRVYAWRLSEGDRAGCRRRRWGSNWSHSSIWPTAGVTLDVPLGERTYFRVGYRMLFHAVIGLGVRF